MKLFSAFLAGSALGQERLPAVQTACAAFRDQVKTDNPIAGDGVWSCPKLNKNSKKTACKATCPGNKIPEFKKASFKVKMDGNGLFRGRSATIPQIFGIVIPKIGISKPYFSTRKNFFPKSMAK